MSSLFDWFKKGASAPNEKNTDQGSPGKKRKDFPNRILSLMRQDKSKTGGYYNTPTLEQKSEEAKTTPKKPKLS